jgi:hypothetical protein
MGNGQPLKFYRSEEGARVVNAYYQLAYITCMETSILAAGRTLILVTFSIDSMSSTSCEMQRAGVYLETSIYGSTNFSNGGMQITEQCREKAIMEDALGYAGDGYDEREAPVHSEGPAFDTSGFLPSSGHVSEGLNR